MNYADFKIDLKPENNGKMQMGFVHKKIKIMFSAVVVTN